jgi:hypothetical protein
MVGVYEFLGIDWYWTSYAYRDEAVAEQAWTQFAKVAKRHRGGLEVGFYRHGTEVSGIILVTAISLKKHGVSFADKTLSAPVFDGFENEPDEHTLQAFIARRVRVVHDMHEDGAESGSYELRRTKGVKLGTDGVPDEGG